MGRGLPQDRLAIGIEVERYIAFCGNRGTIERFPVAEPTKNTARQFAGGTNNLQ